jgi:hypothetical protein
MSAQDNGQTVERPSEGVRLYVPSQPGISVQPKLEDYNTVPGNKPGYKSPKSTSDFTVIRALVSFEVLASPNVNSFTKPARLTVCYKQSDVNAAGSEQKLKLGTWDGNKWRILPQNRSVDCPFPGEDFVGAVEVLLTRPWADPPVAWGGGG